MRCVLFEFDLSWNFIFHAGFAPGGLLITLRCTNRMYIVSLDSLQGEHPGGKKSIMMFAGKDATEEFDMLHDRKVIKKYGIDEGTVELKGTIKK